MGSAHGMHTGTHYYIYIYIRFACGSSEAPGSLELSAFAGMRKHCKYLCFAASKPLGAQDGC